MFPTAGGDAEEIERWLVIRVLQPLIDAGRIKVYSCDSIAGQVWLAQEGSIGYRMSMMNRFQEYVRHEVVPAVHNDCQNKDLALWVTGASIGALHAVAMVCRYPDVFHRALAMSGTYDMMRFCETDEYTKEYHLAAPTRFVPYLAEDSKQLALLRERFILFASGAGRAESMKDTWEMANILGRRRIPNRVDPWGEDWHHDWPTWRAMLPRYLGEWTSE